MYVRGEVEKRRVHRLPVMLAGDELRLFERVAGHAGLGLGTWARARLLVVARREAKAAGLMREGES